MIQQNISLLPYNTLRVEAIAKFFVEINRPDDFAKLQETDVFKSCQDRILFLGGGSNMLLTEDFDGLVIKNNIKTMRLTKFDDESVTLTVGGGYNRHELVIFCAEKGRWGLENLALIPGTVGAAPIQNIGAYGVEVKETIKNVKGFDLTTQNLRALNNIECHFGYRDSIFKQSLKDKFFVTHVTFVLSKKPKPILTYESLTDVLFKQYQAETVTALEIANTVMQVRQSKLPSITDLGTAGSFFKNPLVDEETRDSLVEKFPELKSRPHPTDNTETNFFSLAAGQVLELSGITKGHTMGKVGTYDKHCLILVNHGEKDGSKVRNFAQSLITQVKEKTRLVLEPEVNIL